MKTRSVTVSVGDADKDFGQVHLNVPMTNDDAAELWGEGAVALAIRAATIQAQGAIRAAYAGSKDKPPVRDLKALERVGQEAFDEGPSGRARLTPVAKTTRALSEAVGAKAGAMTPEQRRAAIALAEEALAALKGGPAKK